MPCIDSTRPCRHRAASRRRFTLALLALAAATATAQEASPPAGCLACHQGIAHIRSPESGMMRAIYARGRELGDGQGCLVCHGEDRLAPLPSAHEGWSNEACLLCHETG